MIRRDEENTPRKVFRTDISGKRKRNTREKEDGTPENKMETCNPTIVGKVGLLD